MIIECAKKDMLCFTLMLKDGGEPVTLETGQTIKFRCPIDCAESAHNPDGKVLLEIEGISVTEPAENDNDTPDVIPGLYAFIADLNNIGSEATQVIPGRYPFEVRIETTTGTEPDTVTYHQTIAFEQDNALIIHKGVN